MEELASAIRAEVAQRIAEESATTDASTLVVSSPGSPRPVALEILLRQLLTMAKLLNEDGLAPGGKPSMVGTQQHRRRTACCTMNVSIKYHAQYIAHDATTILCTAYSLWAHVARAQALQYELRDVAAYAEAVSGGSNVQEALLWRHIHTALEHIVAPLQPSANGTPSARCAAGFACFCFSSSDGALFHGIVA